MSFFVLPYNVYKELVITVQKPCHSSNGIDWQPKSRKNKNLCIMLGCKTIWKAMQHVILAGISAGDALKQGHQPVITRE